MATVWRHVFPGQATIVSAHNSLKLQIGAGANFHLDASEQVIAAADATDLPTAILLCTNILAIYQFSMADTLAHKVAGVALASYAFPTTLAECITRANDIKAKYNVHRASTTYHYNADSTNTTTSADATDLASVLTLLNEEKADINAHMASAPSCPSLRLVDP